MRSSSITYTLAIGALLVAVLLRWVLDPLLGDALPLVTLFGAVATAVWLGGYRPAVLITVLGYVACGFLFIPPRGRFGLENLGNIIGLIAYLFTCVLIIGFGEALRRAQVRASERGRLLQVTLASIGDAVITTDVEGRIAYVNAVAETLTGWARQDALGEPLDRVFRIVNESTREPVENPATRALREGVVVGLANHTVLIRKDGRECPIDDSAAPIRDELDVVSGCVLIFRDVTEQRRLQHDRAAQLLTARLLASIVESSDDAIISKSLDGVIQSWNAGAERLFGHTADQVVGRHISLVIPPERISEEDDIIESLKAGRRIEHFETERMRSDGRRVQVSLTISPIRDDTGAVVGASKIARDITERKRIEDDLRRVAATLADGDRRKNEFLAFLAHELRNPLAPISHAVQTLQRRADDAGVVRAASEMLQRQVGHLVRLVDDLLDVSRISQGKIELRLERLDLAPIISQAVDASRALCRSRDQELTLTLPPEPVFLMLDPTRLAQIVGNLLNNASKFTDVGGHISLVVEREGALVAIRVRDDGVGLAEEDLPRIFELFSQVHSSRERSPAGLGIGLTLVKRLVELHGGTIEASSGGPGRGSEFVVRLPALTGVPRPSSPVSPDNRDQQPVSRRILIVDDNEDAANWLATALTLSGHETHVAFDGVTAIDIARRVAPDAVLLDIGLPRLDGYEVCRRIRAQEWGKDLTLVALTGWGQDEDRRTSKEAGFDAHLVKPVDEELLAKLLESLPPHGRGGAKHASGETQLRS